MEKRRFSNGFTLMEMMVTVVIIAILSVVATVGYKRYIHKARVSEAVSFLANIKMKQEAYFNTYGQYVDTSNAEASHASSDLYPDLPSEPPTEMEWEITCPDDDAEYPGWCALGARPTDRTVHFQYVTVGWQPEDADPPNQYIKDPDRRWWYAVAHGDQDGNQVLSTFILTSEITQPHMFNETE